MLLAAGLKQLEGDKSHLQSRIGGETMDRTPTKEIMTDDIIYKNRREQPPDAGA